MEKENIHTEQHTFNGLNRRAMMFGIPLEAVATSSFIVFTLARAVFGLFTDNLCQ